MRAESEADVLNRIEDTRERMGDTIERIGDRVNPDRVQRELKARAREQVREVKDNVKQKARQTMRGMEHEVNEAGHGIWQTIRKNPLPAGMVGVGLAWMLANRGGDADSGPERPRYPEHREPGLGYAYRPPVAGADPGEPYLPGASATGGGQDEESMRDRAEHMVDDVRDRAEDAMDSARDHAEDALDSARDRASQMADSASERWDHAQHAVTRRARRAEHRVEDMVRENPLAAGVVAAALGFAAGLAIPETERENEFMGSTRDRVVDRAQRKLHEVRHVATDVARETASASAKRAVDEVMGEDRGQDDESITGPGR